MRQLDQPLDNLSIVRAQTALIAIAPLANLKGMAGKRDANLLIGYCIPGQPLAGRLLRSNDREALAAEMAALLF